MSIWGTYNLSTAASPVTVTSTGGKQIVAKNPKRVSVFLQHQGSSSEAPCLLKLGGAPSSTDYNYVLATGSSTRNGDGGSLHLTKWRGSVYGITESGNATLSVLEEVDST